MDIIDLIWKSMGCDNCRNNVYPPGTGPCEKCMICQECTIAGNCAICTIPPSAYVPKRGTIQEKVWYREKESITDEEYIVFKDEYSYLIRN